MDYSVSVRRFTLILCFNSVLQRAKKRFARFCSRSRYYSTTKKQPKIEDPRRTSWANRYTIVLAQRSSDSLHSRSDDVSYDTASSICVQPQQRIEYQ